MHPSPLQLLGHTTRRLAVATNPRGLTLLPPIPLYRRLLRAHRTHLGAAERVLGDSYVKAEFRAHQKIDNPIQIVGFLTEWQLYAQQVEGDAWRGGRIEPGKFEKLSDEQVHQLYELMQAIRDQGAADADEGLPGTDGGVGKP